MVFSLTLPSETPLWAARSCELAATLCAEIFLTDPQDRVVYTNEIFRNRRPFLDLSGAPYFADCYRLEAVTGFVNVDGSLDDRVAVLRNMRASNQMIFTRTYKDGVDTCVHERRGDWAIRLGIPANKAAMLSLPGKEAGLIDRIAHAHQLSLRALSMMDLISIPVAMTDGELTVSYYNAAMGDIFYANDGMSIGALGKIAVPAPAEGAALRLAVAYASRNADSLPRIVRLLRPAGRRAHLVTVSHAPPCMAMIQIAPGAERTSGLRYLLEEIGLTGAQADVAIDLGQGMSSDGGGRAAGTRRNHIKAILRSLRELGLDVGGQQGIASMVARLSAIAGRFKS